MRVEASIRILAGGRSLKYCVSRSRSVRILFSTASPASVRMAIWLSFFPRSMPIWSTARLPSLCASSARYGMWGHDATTQGGEPLHPIYRSRALTEGRRRGIRGQGRILK